MLAAPRPPFNGQFFRLGGGSDSETSCDSLLTGPIRYFDARRIEHARHLIAGMALDFLLAQFVVLKSGGPRPSVAYAMRTPPGAGRTAKRSRSTERESCRVAPDQEDSRFMVVRGFSYLAGVVLLGGCGFGPLKYSVNADRLGDVAAAPASPMNPKDVKVVYGAVPAGFELAPDGKTLRVQDGHKHRIIGPLTMRVNNDCCCDWSPLLSRELVFDALRERAAALGANAVVNVASSVPSEQDTKPGCDAFNAARDAAGKIDVRGTYTRVTESSAGMLLATGWAVVVAPE